MAAVTVRPLAITVAGTLPRQRARLRLRPSTERGRTSKEGDRGTPRVALSLWFAAQPAWIGSQVKLTLSSAAMLPWIASQAAGHR